MTQAVKCPDLTVPTNGSIHKVGLPGAMRLFNQPTTSVSGHFPMVVEFRCSDTYKFQRAEFSRRQCQASGQWTGSRPVCLRTSSLFSRLFIVALIFDFETVDCGHSKLDDVVLQLVFVTAKKGRRGRKILGCANMSNC